MEFKVRLQEAKLLDLEFVGERQTVLSLLKERLLEDSKVATATVVSDHPVLASPRLVVRMREGKPTTALKKAAASLRKDLDALEDEFLKALG